MLPEFRLKPLDERYREIIVGFRIVHAVVLKQTIEKLSDQDLASQSAILRADNFTKPTLQQGLSVRLLVALRRLILRYTFRVELDPEYSVSAVDVPRAFLHCISSSTNLPVTRYGC